MTKKRLGDVVFWLVFAVLIALAVLMPMIVSTDSLLRDPDERRGRINHGHRCVWVPVRIASPEPVRNRSLPLSVTSTCMTSMKRFR
jgi:hypothetical protein